MFNKITKRSILIWFKEFIQDDSYKTINILNKKVNFFVPNQITQWRVETFFTKEPETLEWIDSFNDNKKIIFWDVGANIGLYSCYAVKRADCQVYAFEPSVFNLELLAKNIYLNSLSDKIAIISFPLFDNLAVRPFYMTSKEWGGCDVDYEWQLPMVEFWLKKNGYKKP